MSTRLPVPVTKEEFNLLLAAAIQDREKRRKKRSGKLTKRGTRIQQYIIAMILGFGGGMRISEIVGYKGKSRRKSKKNGEIVEKDVVIPSLAPEQVETNMIRILCGKGGKDRVTLLPTRIFQTAKIKRAELLSYLPLTVKRRGIQDYTEKLGHRVLNKNISFHKYRHGFGSTLANAKRPLHEIQMLMGHSRLDTTGIYLHANPQNAIKGAEEVF
jgi:integrase